MAFSAVFSRSVLHFKPLSASRPETDSSKQRAPAKNTRAARKLKPRKFRPPPLLPLSTAVEGGDATTFTRLPPRDDFGFDDLALQSVSEVIKLADIKAPAPKVKPKKFDQKPVEENVFDSIIGASEENSGPKYVVDDEFDEEEGIVKKVGYDDDNGRFELYEVGSDDEFDDDDEDEVDGEGGSMAFGEEEGEEEDDEEGVREKEKGVPAVMRCFDRAKIFVKAGDGGNGVVAFRREKFVPLGGPSGGDGGRGGNMYMEVDGTMNSLLPFRKSIHFRGGRGSHGQGQQKNGAKGESVVVKVPPGTVVRESGGDVLFELLHPGQRALLLPGGRGGRGNASFKTGTNKVPKIAENGEEGLEL